MTSFSQQPLPKSSSKRRGQDRAQRRRPFRTREEKLSHFEEHMLEYTQELSSVPIKASGLKITPPRMQVLTVLQNISRPLTVTEIRQKICQEIRPHHEIRPKTPAQPKTELGEVTAYRILEQFVDRGVACKVELGDGRMRYELAYGRPHHHHIVCTKCGLIEDVPVCDVGNFQKQIVAHMKNFSTIHDHSLEFFGVCSRCEN